MRKPSWPKSLGSTTRAVVERGADAARDAMLPVDGEEPVAVDAEDEGRRGDARERILDAAPIAADVVRVHRLDEGDVAVRVEATGEPVAVEVEVRRDGEATAVAQGAHAGLPGALEALVQLGRRAVVQQRHAPRERESAVRAVAVAGVVVLAALEARIDVDRLELHGVERDLVRGVDRRCRQDADPRDAVGKADGPLERVHPAHRSAEDRGPHVDAERVGEAHLCGDLVADREVREARGPLVAVRRDARWPGRTLASAEHVRRDDEPAVGVDGRAGADDLVPPSLGRMPRPGGPAHVAVAGERVQDQHGVVARGGELSPCLVREAVGRELPPALGAERAERGEVPVADRVAVAPGAGRRAVVRAAGARRPP